ncbi:hypothetical protein RFN25_30530 [Mesorhizobium abyssinicae]|uniref:hypothetical protein n=1 Tax=Mesorhizobium abyssinicae TaxID=1209958 RepID=UPI002A24738C|nr:hypothetical protein [Mesorhizobium abyssinicae]MDX8437742.1 hypothetical protein [Mesorhizobium abyssinicae]
MIFVHVEGEPNPRDDRDPVALFGRGLQLLGRRCAFLWEPATCGADDWPDCQTGAQALLVRRTAVERKDTQSTYRKSGALSSKPASPTIFLNQSLRSVLLCTSAKLLCIEDRIFDLTGGAELARWAANAASRAGRKVALLCHDTQSVYRNQQRIIGEIGLRIGILIGEPRSILPIYDFHRIDSLVPRLAREEIALIMNRMTYPPLVLGPDGELVLGDACVSEEDFWSVFAPAELNRWLAPNN